MKQSPSEHETTVTERTWSPGDPVPLPDLPESCYPPGGRALVVRLAEDALA